MRPGAEGSAPAGGELEIHPLTPRRMDDLGCVLRGGPGAGCWCMYPRLTAERERALPGPGSVSQRRRAALQELARRRRAPGLLAYLADEPVAWVAVAPRSELARIASSRATPPLDDTAVWVIPCITVRRSARGRGIAAALIRAAVAYAARHGAPAVEAYARAGNARVRDDNAYFGTEPLFRRAGLRVVRPAPPDLPRGWVPRVTMRVQC